jgi:hypothetical protein
MQCLHVQLYRYTHAVLYHVQGSKAERQTMHKLSFMVHVDLPIAVSALCRCTSP